MPLLSTNGTIVLEPVNCYPGSAEGSRCSFSQVLSFWMRQRLIMLIYGTTLDNYDFRN